MEEEYVVVEGLVRRGRRKRDRLNLRTDAWSIALEQRAFGPRRLMVAFASADGDVRSVAHTARLDPPEDGLDPCIRSLGLGSRLAVAFCDEMVVEGPPPDDLAERFLRARAIAASWNIHLLDWVACDDQLFRSSRLAICPEETWWDLPSR